MSNVRRKVIAANWKMNLGPREARDFIEGFEPPSGSDRVRTLLFPPALSLAAVREGMEHRDLSPGLGVQNIHPEPSGAFTGELSAEMAADAGAGFVLVGHSERRQLFGETPDDTARKVAAALRAGLVPVLCIGETLDERRSGRLEEVLGRQLEAVLTPPTLRKRFAGEAELILAYEPVWAIGTGETATPGDASEAHTFLRERVEGLIGEERAGETVILYGGSVKPENAGELLGAPHVDGALVGGASLKPDSFAAIIMAGIAASS